MTWRKIAVPFRRRIFRTFRVEGEIDALLIPATLESTTFHVDESKQPTIGKKTINFSRFRVGNNHEINIPHFKQAYFFKISFLPTITTEEDNISKIYYQSNTETPQLNPDKLIIFTFSKVIEIISAST